MRPAARYRLYYSVISYNERRAARDIAAACVCICCPPQLQARHRDQGSCRWCAPISQTHTPGYRTGRPGGCPSSCRRRSPRLPTVGSSALRRCDMIFTRIITCTLHVSIDRTALAPPSWSLLVTRSHRSPSLTRAMIYAPVFLQWWVGYAQACARPCRRWPHARAGRTLQGRWLPGGRRTVAVRSSVPRCH